MTIMLHYHKLLSAFAFLSLFLVSGCGDGDGRKNAPPPTATGTSTATPSNTVPSPLPPTSTATAAHTATSQPTATPTATHTPTSALPPLPTGLRARGSVEQVYVLGAVPGEQITLMAGSSEVMSGTADANGSLIFRMVPAGDGYRIVTESNREIEVGRVLRPDEHPDPSFYRQQKIGPGYGYLETRDGTLLAVNVILPGPVEEGPYPTLVEYSGYEPANPGQPQPSMLLGRVLGYAVAGVNMRGMGCSGGAFDFFETLQSTDGYDAIEAIAAQPWVKNNRVGMIGLSYPGITQLFVAATRPPHLASIAPLSVIADIGQGILYPGGILNNGFAVEWAIGRQHDATPGGQLWSQERMDNGDVVCIANQLLRGQTPDILAKIEANPFYYPEVADPLSPQTFVHKIEVPVFLAGAWQDEQTGGYFANMLEHFTGTDKLHFTLVNGGHTEPLAPAIFTRWVEFLQLYVAQEVPKRPFTVPFIVQALAEAIFDTRTLRLEPERFTGMTYEDALAAFEAEPRVRILFENGAGGAPGAPVHTFEMSFDRWPVPGLQAAAWYFGAGGSLSPEPPAGGGADSFIYDPSRAQLTTYSGANEGIWKALPEWDWPQPRPGRELAYATEPLAETLVMAGPASVDLWLESTAPDVDLQTVLTEIRPDGQEVYVSAGWLRASHRKLDESRSTALRPVPSHREEDAAELPPGEAVQVRVEVYPFAHVFRAGSRIRVIIGAPGAVRPRWKFRVLEPAGEVINTVRRSAAMPSRVVLPVIPGAAAPARYPACPGLRGQPCRPYQPLVNTEVE